MIKPPRWIDAFLEWYCNPSLLEEIQGDAYELYARKIKKSNKRFADLQYLWNVIRFFRWSNIRRIKNNSDSTTFSLTMLRSYFIIGFRNAIRNGMTTGINLIGLSIAIGCAITTFLLIDLHFHSDRFHVNAENTYQVVNHIKNGNEIETWSRTPFLLGPALKESYEAVEATFRVHLGNGNVKYENTIFNESLAFVDKEFLTSLSFPIRYGNDHGLYDKNSIVLSAVAAQRYFANSDAVGKIMSIKFNDNQKENFTVTAVLDETPGTSSIHVNILLSIDKLADLNASEHYNWSSFTDATFVVLKPGNTPAQLLSSMDKWKKLQNAAVEQWPYRSLSSSASASYHNMHIRLLALFQIMTDLK
jgi:putative ABC transport system permease protein